MHPRLLIIALASFTGITTVAAWMWLDGEAEKPQALASISTFPDMDASLSAREFEPILAAGPPAADTLEDAAIVGGYSGTLEARAAVDRRQLPRERLPDWPETASPEQAKAVAKALSQAKDYNESLRRLWQLCGDVKRREDRTIKSTRFDSEPHIMASLLFESFAASAGVARQFIIFHVALALPPEAAFPWLRELTRGADEQDAADALCALAFRGDADAMARFESLPPSAVDCRRIADTAGDHDALARAGERAFLRSYRCIEALDSRPYFLRHAWAFRRGAAPGIVPAFPWAELRQRAERPLHQARAARALSAWLRHFPGHPGSDDMCYRLALRAAERGEFLEAAEWASIGATEPDQDMKGPCTALLLTLLEFHLESHVLTLLLTGRAYERNRQLVHYVRMRRAAAEEGFEAALLLADALSVREPDSLLAACFRARWSREPARGLTSGIEPLPLHDPLRTEYGPGFAEDWPRYVVNPAARHGSAFRGRDDDRPWQEQRLRPLPEAIQFPAGQIADQFRLWETQAELQRRAWTAHGGELADIRYKIAAVFYHNPWVLYPAYAELMGRSGLPGPNGRYGELRLTEDGDRMLHGFHDSVASYEQATRLFLQLANEQPSWNGRDKVLFSAAMAQVKLGDRPEFGRPRERIREGVLLFERMAAEHPDSSLASSARAAADYWRRVAKYLFKE